MTLSSDFLFDVGDFACMATDIEQERPNKVQIVCVCVLKDFSGTHRAYHVRSHTAYNSDLLQVAEPELMPYPTDEFLRERDEYRAEQRERAQEARRAHKAAKAAEKAA